MKLNILHITPDFNYACGRSYYVFLLLKYLRAGGHKVMLITNGGDSLERLDENDIPYEIFKSLKTKNPVSFASNVKKIKRAIKENDFNIVHTHHRYNELLAVHAARTTHNRKFRTVFTALSIVNRRYRVEYRSDKIIVVSNTVKKMLIDKFKVDPGKISLIHNFTDTEEIQKHEAAGSVHKKQGDYFNLLSIGRFHREKNYETLLKAMNILKHEKIKLMLIGEGKRENDYMKYIKHHKLNVEITGPQKGLGKYFQIADLCVLPSIADPFPNFMLQSGLHKKPFIGSDVDGIAELIINGRNGMLFKSGDENELSQKILEMKTNKNLSQTCAENFYHDVRNNYTEEAIIPKIEKLYRAALNN